MKKILLLGLRHWSTSSSIHQSRNAFTPIYHTCPYQIPASTNIVQPQLDHSEYVKLGLYSSRVDLIKTRERHNICPCKTVRKLKIRIRISTSTCKVCHRDIIWRKCCGFTHGGYVLVVLYDIDLWFTSVWP